MIPPVKRAARLQHVRVALRLSVDTERWDAFTGVEVSRDRRAEEIRVYAVAALEQTLAYKENAIVAVRRDQR